VCVLWSWSGESLEEDHPLLSDEVLEGIGSAGAGYNTHRWRELAFLIAAVRDLKSRASEERKAILDDPWTFSGWLSGLHEARNRQLIHILPHLLFPETLERISSEGDKRLILASYGDAPEKEIRKWDTSKIDRALLDLRRSLEEEHGTDIDFYQDEFATEWKSQTKNWLLSWNPSRWEWNTIAEDRANTIAGGHDEWTNETVVLDEEIRALKWKLWHGQVDRTIEHLEEIIADMSMLRDQGDLDALKSAIWRPMRPHEAQRRRIRIARQNEMRVRGTHPDDILQRDDVATPGNGRNFLRDAAAFAERFCDAIFLGRFRIRHDRVTLRDKTRNRLHSIWRRESFALPA
jgi:hypothetical protein